MVELATHRYKTFLATMGVPVQTSLGRPKWWALSRDLEKLPELMPDGLFGKDLSEEEFTRRYRERLDQIGVDALTEKFEAIAARHRRGTRTEPRLVLLCFEDVNKGEFCHRRLFADFWTERTGQPVPELAQPMVVHMGSGPGPAQLVMPIKPRKEHP